MTRNEDVKLRKKCSGCCWNRNSIVSENIEFANVEKSNAELGSAGFLEDGHDVPFRENLPSTLNAGKAVCINGFVPRNSSRFAINFCCGLDVKSDIALHVNPRLDQNYVVRNSRIGGRWGEEETTAYSRSNMKWNEKFKIDILIAVQEFLISINEQHFCNFGYRVPIEKVTAVVVTGDVQIQTVTYENWRNYPLQPVLEDIPIVPANTDYEEIEQKTKSIPFCGRLPPNFKDEYQVEIYGRVKLLPRTFFINLQKGYYLWPHPTIYLHFNPRFGGNTDTKHVIRNAWIDGQWGPEERVTTFPFQAGKLFHLVIYTEDDQFVVSVDGILVSEFQFRASPNIIDCLYIQGDVVINCVALTKRDAPSVTPRLPYKSKSIIRRASRI